MKNSSLFYAILFVGVLAFANCEDGLEIAKETATPTTAPKGHDASQGTVADRERLVAKLFSDYNKRVNPDTPDVKFGLALINFHVCDDRQVVESYVWFKETWQDARLKWDKDEFGGLNVIRYDSNEVWKPDITLYNSAGLLNWQQCFDTNVLIYSSGEVLWVPPCKLVSHCKLNKREPYGEQTCNLKFGSWTFDGLTMDLNFYKNQTEVDISDLTSTSNYEIISTTAERHSKYYSCCAEPYLDVEFNITMKRIPGEELLKRL